jgi:hypothetical protein
MDRNRIHSTVWIVKTVTHAIGILSRQRGIVPAYRKNTVVPAKLSAEFARAHPKARLRLLDSDYELLNVLDAIWQEASSFLLG